MIALSECVSADELTCANIDIVLRFLKADSFQAVFTLQKQIYDAAFWTIRNLRTLYRILI